MNANELFAELFIIGEVKSRETLTALLASILKKDSDGFTVCHQGVEFEVRNNPRRKGHTDTELRGFEDNPNNGWINTPFAIEAAPVESLGEDAFVSEVRFVVAELASRGLTIRVASDLEEEIKN